MKLTEKFERIMAAAAFAEEDERETALELLGEPPEAARDSASPPACTKPYRPVLVE